METLNYPERRLPADSLASANRQPLIDIDDVHTLAQGIVDTIRDPLLVLDQHLRVVSTNRAFCQTFRMTHQNVEDRPESCCPRWKRPTRSAPFPRANQKGGSGNRPPMRRPDQYASILWPATAEADRTGGREEIGDE